MHQVILVVFLLVGHRNHSNLVNLDPIRDREVLDREMSPEARDMIGLVAAPTDAALVGRDRITTLAAVGQGRLLWRFIFHGFVSGHDRPIGGPY